MKGQIAWLEKQGQNPVEWSDENKNIIDGIIEYLECFNDYDCGDEPYEEYYKRFEKYIKFMKSLKPQSHWKPSEDYIKENKRIIERLIQAISEDIPLSSGEAFDCLSWLKSLKD